MFLSVMMAVLKGHYAYDIPLNEISRISKTKHGFNKNVFTVHTINGSEYRWSLNFEKYFTQISEVLSSQFGIEMREISEEVWEAIQPNMVV